MSIIIWFHKIYEIDFSYILLSYHYSCTKKRETANDLVFHHDSYYTP